MKKNTDIQNELKSMGSSLAGMSQAMPYTVPPGYFEHFAVDITATVTAINNEVTINEGGRSMPYGDKPAGYFDQFPARVLQLAKTAETRKPLLIDLTPKTKRRTLMKPVKWAAAAVLVLGISIGSYNLFFSHKETGTDKMLSSVPNNELHDYLQSIYRIDVDRIIDNKTLMNMQLDNKDIIKYLDETGWDVVD